MIKSKAISSAPEENDGLRVCVMSSIHEEYEFDIWWKDIAPARELIEAYVIKQEMSWEQFRPLYEQELATKGAQIEVLVKLARELRNEGKDLTLLCGEASYHRCHREIIREKCLAIDENIWAEEKEV